MASSIGHIPRAEVDAEYKASAAQQPSSSAGGNSLRRQLRRLQVPFDTTFLIALRLLVSEPEGANATALREKLCLTTDHVTHLCDMRRRYVAMLSSGLTLPQEQQQATGLSIWCETWFFLETVFSLRETFALYIPPIFGDGPRALLKGIYREVWRREVLDGVMPTGHPVISGMTGTGKTTIVKAIAIATAICSPEMFLLFASYDDETGVAETQWSVPYVLRELLVRFKSANVDGAFGHLSIAASIVAATPDIARVLGYLRVHCGLRVGIIADEIQNVIKLESSTLEARISIMAGLQAFARLHVKTLMVLTSSSSHLREYLARVGCRPGFEGFPSFKHYLYQYFTTCPSATCATCKSTFARDTDVISTTRMQLSCCITQGV